VRVTIARTGEEVTLLKGKRHSPARLKRIVGEQALDNRHAEGGGLGKLLSPETSIASSA
jgi:hypothetical protein